MAKKQRNCDPADAQCGDHWDHVAYDPEHRLVLAVVPWARTIENAEAITAEVKSRLGYGCPTAAPKAQPAHSKTPMAPPRAPSMPLAPPIPAHFDVPITIGRAR